MHNSSSAILLKARISSSINKSPSKVSYSFSKAERFHEKRRDNYYAFYNIPDTKSARYCSLGYGDKSDFTKNAKHSCGSLYSLPSIFNPKNPNSPQYSFGTSREDNKIQKRNITPGPKYNLSRRFGSDAPSFTLGEKRKEHNINRSSNIPGPGAYYNSRNHILGKYSESKFKNAACVSIGGTAKRFKYSVEMLPGPGQYQLPSLINEKGCIYESKYKSIPARSFIGKRNENRIKKDMSPGPGSYDSFSEFEGYEQKKHRFHPIN